MNGLQGHKGHIIQQLIEALLLTKHRKKCREINCSRPKKKSVICSFVLSYLSMYRRDGVAILLCHHKTPESKSSTQTTEKQQEVELSEKFKKRKRKGEQQTPSEVKALL